MSFLHGVLESVRDDESVTKYSDINDINNVIKKLNDSVGKGREAFRVAVTQVEEKIKNVTGPLSVLKNDIKQHKDNIDAESVHDISQQITDWIYRAQWYIDRAQRADEALNDIDPQLSGKLKCNISLLLQATRTFLKTAENNDLDVMFQVTEKNLNEVITYAAEKFQGSIQHLKKYFKYHIGKLHRKLEELRDGQFNNLKTFVETDIQNALDTVSEDTKMLEWRYVVQVVNNVNEIKTKTQELKGQIQREKEILRSQVGELQKRINDLKEASAAVKTAIKDDTLDSIKSHLNLDQKIIGLKEELNEKLKDYVIEYVKLVREKVGLIKNAVGNKGKQIGGGKSIDHNWEKLKEEVARLVGEINGNGEDYKGLNGIRERVKGYAGTFKSKFESDILPGWIKGILQHNVIVKKKLDRYVELYRINLGDSYKTVENIIPKVKETIVENIQEAIKQVKTQIASAGGDMKTNITAVINSCNVFASQIETKIKQTDEAEGFSSAGSVALVSTIVKGMEKIVVQNHNGSYNKGYLTEAITLTLTALVASARQTASVLWHFTHKNSKAPAYNLADNVELAMGDVELIGKEFFTKTGNSFGRDIQVSLDGVKSEIQSLDTQLGTALIPSPTPPSTSTLSNTVDLNDKIDARVKLNIDAANNRLKDLLKATADKAIGKMQDAINVIVDPAKGAETTLTKIKMELEKLQTKNNVEGDNSASDLHEKATELETKINMTLINAGKMNDKDGDEKKTVFAALTKLKDDIKAFGTKLAEAKKKVGLVENELKECINDTDKLFKDIPAGVEYAMNQLHRDVKKKMTDAFHSVLDEAKRRYSATKNREVEALQKIVNAQYEIITEIIAKDKITGLKGLMPKIYGGNIPTSQAPPLVPSQESTLLTKLNTAVNSPDKDEGTKFKELSEASKNYLDPILEYVSSQVHSPHSSQSRSPQVGHLKQQLDNLLTNLKLDNKQYHFDHTFTGDLAALTPKQFNGHQHPELLDALAAGAKRLAEELGKQYVNRYSGLKWADIGEPDREKCAKVLLTLLSTLKTNLSKLRKLCLSSGKFKQIKKSNELGEFFFSQGFNVSEDGKQHWELQDKSKMDGRNIHKCLVGDRDHVYHSDREAKRSLDILVEHLNQYNQVSHHATLSAKKHPCNVYQMLSWLTGLPHNHIYNQLKDHITNMFKVPDKNDPSKKIVKPVEAYPFQFTNNNVHDALKHLASRCQNLICTIAGHGDALTTYGCDFSSNALQLQYSSSPAACFDTLVDLLRRLFPPLKFLQIQCKYSARDFGWADCIYGNGIYPSNWQCNDHPSNQPKCQSTCRPASPLQSYLNDCLPGHLPHHLSSIGCRTTCSTCPSTSKKGMPCMTPLGFRAFSGSTKTGKELCEIINKILANGYLAALFCLVPKAPSSLPEHFSFVLGLVSDWHGASNYDKTSVQKAFESSIKSASISLYENPPELTSALRNAYNSKETHHGTRHREFNTSDLSSLSIKKPCMLAHEDVYCAPYLFSLYCDSYHYIAGKYADAYLSWALYLPGKALDDIDERKKSLENLKESLAKFTEHDNCKNLLTNLTEGLETFLGFDKDSKGYDGTGIVYSDLDRLCDGVMAFILQCLQGSKTLLHHYYPQIIDTIRDLESKIGKGLGVTGFAQAIGIVQRGLREYESVLSTRTDGVTSQLTSLSGTISRLNTEFNNMHNSKLAEQIDKIKPQAQYYLLKAEAAEAARNELDGTLKGKLECNVKSVLQVVKSFKEVAEKQEVRDQASRVDSELDHHRQQVNHAITTGVSGLQHKFSVEFDKIGSELATLKNKKLTEKMTSIVDGVSEARRTADELLQNFDNDYSDLITGKFTEIKESLKDVNIDTSFGGTGKASKLKKHVADLRSKVGELEEIYQNVLKTIKREVNSAVDSTRTTVDDLKEKIKEDLKKLRDTTVKNAIETFSKRLNEDVKIMSQVAEASGDLSKLKLKALKRLAEAAQQKTLQYENSELGAAQNSMDLEELNHGFKTILGKFTSTSSATNVPKTFVDTMTSDINDAVKDALDKIENKDPGSTFDTHMENFRNHKLLKVNRNWHPIRQAIDKYFDKKQNDVIDVETLGDYFSKLDAYNKTMKDVNIIINKLENMPTDVDNKNEQTSQLLQLLRQQIENVKDKIDDIEDSVNNAASKIREAINRVEQTASTARTAAKSGLEDLQSTLLKQVESSFSTLTHQVQSLFAKQKQAELTQLQNVIETQLEAINDIIREDKATGVKGFFKEMNRLLGSQFERSSLSDGMKLPELAEKAFGFFDPLFEYVDDEIMPKNSKGLRTLQSQPSDPYVTKVRNISSKLSALLRHLTNNSTRNYNFNHNFATNLASLIDAVNEFGAVKFGEGQHPDLLNIVRTGMNDFAKQLKYAYINMYDTQSIKWQEVKDDDFVLTESAMRCAKIALTTVPILLSEFEVLLKNTSIAGDWYTLSIHLHNNSNALGAFFKTAGYGVPKSEDMSNEELKNKEDFCGEQIHDLLTKTITHKFINTNKSVQIIDGLAIEHEEQNGLLQKLHGCLVKYFSVCHLTHIDKPRSPCSIYEMLAWCAGLQFNSIFEPLCSYFKELFQKPKDQKDVPYDQIENSSLSLVGTKTIHPSHLVTALNDVCSRSYSLLVGILGNGHANGVYACEFPSNSLNLSYPSSPSQCLAILADVLYRLYQQLIFLYQQCKHGQFCSGWNKCWYGQGIAGSSWSCNTLQCPNQTGDQNADQKGNQKHNQTCDQKCKQHSDCGIKSPLQSFLEDGLVGFLPHQLTKLGCGVACSLGDHRGQPCITPMGIPDLSAMASHRQAGKYLEEVLYEFCGKPDKPLTQLCSYLTCMSQRTPQTLGDLFAFYSNFLDKWNSNDGHKRYAFVNAVQSANFGDPKTTLEIGPMFGSSDHAGQTHPNADLHSLVKCESNSGDASLPCGPYLMPICRDIWNTFSSKNSGKYLSWIVYLSETFYDLLKKLYDDCCATCDRKGTRCYEKCCAEKCKVKYTDTDGNSITPSTDDKHTSDCSSIVKCPHTLRTLSKYGFYFGSSWRMSGERGEKTKRTCRDLCQALDRVLSKKKEDRAALAKLIYETIPNFLWKIREPFSLTLVALWSLSLLYLLHITVVRLDVLRIRSHLRSPSSHRIAAQSLLAAARVRALANVKYFSP
ncbi:hypothetical protein, conserved [Babesia ovata]|uniref:Extracellular matrix-binding ebh n=1 Tax=Babesia ovata TaxID=189622 RepID=A0A2H6KJM3_9APIC|nr:uncharacterized protein BOVATA_046740 [Babesia ovata]GBE63181.1 hypothetical protein, conserved [Babesia ovata]